VVTDGAQPLAGRGSGVGGPKDGDEFAGRGDVWRTGPDRGARRGEGAQVDVVVVEAGQEGGPPPA
jgi:hypothetical protein